MTFRAEVYDRGVRLCRGVSEFDGVGVGFVGGLRGASGCEDTTCLSVVSYELWLLNTCFPNESLSVRARHFFW